MRNQDIDNDINRYECRGDITSKDVSLSCIDCPVKIKCINLANKKTYIGYKISKAYKRVTIWTFRNYNKDRISTGICEPNKEFTKQQRYEVIAKRLLPLIGFKIPYSEKQ